MKIIYTIFILLCFSTSVISQKIASSSTFKIAIYKDSTLWGWGVNESGQLGDGTDSFRLKPKLIEKNKVWKKIYAGGSECYAIKFDGTLWAWGNNTSGQLGDGSKINSFKPKQIGSDKNWENISVTSYANNGIKTVLGIKTDGTIWGWGGNTHGQIGDGTKVDKSIPTKIGVDNNWKYISIGGTHSLGIKTNGSLWIWGDTYGQLGNTTTFEKLVPTQIGNDLNWSQAAGGFEYSVCIKNDGSIWGVGWNLYGQLGDGSFIDKYNPIQIGNSKNWVSVICEDDKTIALKNDNSIWTWGDMTGFDVNTPSNIPLQFGSDKDWKEITSSCAIKNNNTYWSWRENNQGQIGNGKIGQKLIPNKINVDSAVQISARLNNTLFFNKRDSSIYAMGSFHNINSPSPYKLVTINSLVKYEGGPSTLIVLKKDGTIWAWGSNRLGFYGDGTIIDKTGLIQIGKENNWVDISLKNSFVLGLKSDGTIWQWGNTASGPLKTPTKIGIDQDWISISAGYSTGLAMKKDGSLWGWGGNFNGQIGDGTKADKQLPVKISTANDWKTFFCGINSSLAIKKDGTVWAWGSDYKDSLYSKSLTPSKISNDTDWDKIASGTSNIYATKLNGSLWVLGDNYAGQIGDGTLIPNLSTFKQIGNETNWETIRGGTFHVIGLKKDGTLWTWGFNQQGQLGDGEGVYLIPQQIYFCDFTPLPISNNISLCLNAVSDTLKASALAGNQLVWYNTNLSNGIGSTSSPKPNTSAIGSINYYVSQLNNTTNCESEKLKIIVTINPLPAPPIVKDTSYCINATIDSLKYNSPFGFSTMWYGTNQTGGIGSAFSTKPNTSILGITNYYLSQVNIISSCESPRAKIGVTIKPLTSAPVISKDLTNFLVSNSNYGNFWYKDGTLLSDTSQRFKPISSGSYTVKNNLNGCLSLASNPYYYLITGIINLSNEEYVRFGPNPFSDEIKLNFYLKNYKNLNLEIYQLSSGKLIITKSNIITGSSISLKSFSPGTYIFKSKTNDNKIIEYSRIIKM